MKSYFYILIIILTASKSYSQLGYTWYKTFSDENEFAGSLSLYKDTAFAITSKRTAPWSITTINSVYINFADQNGDIVKISDKISECYDGYISSLPLTNVDENIVFGSYNNSAPDQACSDRLKVGSTSSETGVRIFESNYQFNVRYPTSVLKGNKNLYYVTGDEYRSATQGQCYVDSVNRFIVAYDYNGSILWERSYTHHDTGFSPYFYASNLLPYSDHELISYGDCDVNIYHRTVGFFKLDALTGNTISFFYLDLGAQLPVDTVYRFETGFSYGNIALTKDHEIAFCGVVDTLDAPLVGGKPFIGICDLNGNLKWFKRILYNSQYSRVKILPLSNGNIVLTFTDRLNFKFWIYIFDKDGNIISNKYVENTIYYNSPYDYNDAVLTPTGDLITIGNTTRQVGSSFVSGDPFIAKIGSIGIPYTNPWENNMEDVASYYNQPFILYPNPTFGFTNIKTGRDGMLTIYTTLGQVVWSDSVHHFDDSIDLTFLASGLYLYDFYEKGASQKVFGKFIKE